ncbi:L,D-transpeptidase [Streptomyces palmae]|uniref:L,D-transpeptidase n=1 Tax=Streptomyces palmae TaxID=1701085 RepID=A0A4Z0H753_9ACTN|nr:Ig-like domain-containing protein [Streptomyces palmae]TGB05992.1 L,D-transpeptidase [Streptomyces palmae]
MSHRSRHRVVPVSALLLAPLAVGLAACTGQSDPLADKPYDAGGQLAFEGIGDNHRANPDKPLRVTAKGRSRITDVTATDAAGRYVRGELSADGRKWHSTTPLAAGTHYTLRVSTENAAGKPGRRAVEFDTTSADRRLRVTFGPAGGTYGVGQPITASLSAPVKDPAARALVERSLKVSSQPAVEGMWHWVDDRTLHYRPRAFWPTHAAIDVRSTLDGVKVGQGLYGGPAKPVRLYTGDRVEAVTDASAHQMSVYRNGELLRTIPVTAGRPGSDTRNGVKVILSKEPTVRMTSASIGAPDFFDLPVHWAARVTWSGEYLHAAPWSEGAQGAVNVSHGCVGMSTENARWLFGQVRVGDVVRVVNSGGNTMTPFDNGFGDWNVSWADWTKGSALTGAQALGSKPADTARLRPRV